MNGFDDILNVDHGGESKYNPQSLTSLFGHEDVLSYWMAETDFRCPPHIQKALQDAAESAYFPYQYKTPQLKEAIAGWFGRRHQLVIDPGSIIFSTGVMTGVAAAVEAFSKKGDGVIIQPPVFGDFKNTVAQMRREVVKNSLILTDGSYSINFDELREQASQPANKILLLCSPHNPVGRVWTRSELETMVSICAETDTVLLSDEIHADVIYSGHTFVGALALSDQWNKIFMLGSPGKSFGIPGIADAFITCNDGELLSRVHKVIHRYHMFKSNALTNAATLAGYGQEDQWMNDFISYLEGNIAFAHEFVDNELPGVTCTPPEGTYQLWLDFRSLELDVKALRTFLAGEAKIGLNPGYGYGREGAGFARMNIACPRVLIEQGLKRLREALRNIN